MSLSWHPRAVWFPPMDHDFKLFLPKEARRYFTARVCEVRPEFFEVLVRGRHTKASIHHARARFRRDDWCSSDDMPHLGWRSLQPDERVTWVKQSMRRAVEECIEATKAMKERVKRQNEKAQAKEGA